MLQMNQIEIHEYARQLRDQCGLHAILVAAQKASSFERSGETEQASEWRQIEAALKVMQAPHQS
jgi:hypothetical protein